ncbi:hypothetical protein FHR33_000680 [Nonomuraea dietziae]|uniref:Uncharacterized protein n=1 Tax=Nonomuraea dietziae TaxID=65515 RepID=A0A7W5UZC7_9ACTN|nr:hypothetical protein [Nonomuraea dietziae]
MQGARLVLREHSQRQGCVLEVPREREGQVLKRSDFLLLLIKVRIRRSVPARANGERRTDAGPSGGLRPLVAAFRRSCRPDGGRALGLGGGGVRLERVLQRDASGRRSLDHADRGRVRHRTSAHRSVVTPVARRRRAKLARETVTLDRPRLTLGGGLAGHPAGSGRCAGPPVTTGSSPSTSNTSTNWPRSSRRSPIRGTPRPRRTTSSKPFHLAPSPSRTSKAGTTWWMPDFPPETTPDRVQGVLHDGPYETKERHP